MIGPPDHVNERLLGRSAVFHLALERTREDPPHLPGELGKGHIDSQAARALLHPENAFLVISVAHDLLRVPQGRQHGFLLQSPALSFENDDGAGVALELLPAGGAKLLMGRARGSSLRGPAALYANCRAGRTNRVASGFCFRAVRVLSAR